MLEEAPRKAWPTWPPGPSGSACRACAAATRWRGGVGGQGAGAWELPPGGEARERKAAGKACRETGKQAQSSTDAAPFKGGESWFQSS